MAVDPIHPGIDFISGEFWGRDPHDDLAWLRAHSPVHWDGRAWGITRYDDVREISKQPELFSNAGGIRPDAGPIPMMIDMDDPEHWKRRKLVNRGFTPRRVRASEDRIREVCGEIIDRVCERGECDFVWDIAAPLPLIMIGDALGVAPEDRQRLLEWSDAMLRGLTGDPAALDAATEAFLGYTEYAGRVIADRRAERRDDLMSVLVHAEVDGDRLDHDSLIHESLLILVGGDETTRHVISGGGWQLLAERSRWERLAADPGRIPCAVEEMLRWVSPIKNMARTVTSDVTFRGQAMKAGQKVLLLYPSANRDEAAFDDPFTFDIDRDPNDHVAFGFGPHFCLGNSLARLELQVMFEQLLARLPDLELVDEAEPAFRAANFISGYEAMPVRFTPSRRRAVASPAARHADPLAVTGHGRGRCVRPHRGHHHRGARGRCRARRCPALGRVPAPGHRPPAAHRPTRRDGRRLGGEAHHRGRRCRLGRRGLRAAHRPRRRRGRRRSSGRVRVGGADDPPTVAG
jgi:cytochrome P450 family 142 subfamily A polypeptide 1